MIIEHLKRLVSFEQGLGEVKYKRRIPEDDGGYSRELDRYKTDRQTDRWYSSLYEGRRKALMWLAVCVLVEK